MIYQPLEDSYLLEKEVVRRAKGKKVLDVGTGSGIQALAAIKSEAKEVLAVDIDAESVKAVKKNGINAIKSDLFSKIKKGKRFDLIIFNPPYLPEDEREDSESSLATSGGKKGDEIIVRFLKNAGKYLEKNGKILMVISSLTPLKRIEKEMKRARLEKKVVASEKYFMERLEVWLLSAE